VTASVMTTSPMSVAGDRSEGPFVGLRPFYTSDAKWFFGRNREIAALTRKLRASRFTAVVGPSGSGKSSIVRAGVVPPLQTDGWRQVIAKPGSAPLARLAAALSDAGPPGPLADARRLRFEAMLRASAFGLANIAETLRPEAPTLLIVVDQFEEIFRYGHESAGAVQAAMKEEARAFVELLLTAANREGGNAHICVTMRSDYFGSCSNYVGLAEAVSASQFLVPLPQRSQMEEAIRGPVAKAGGMIEEGLIQRLLVDVVEEVDQLPLLQHTLRRLWEKTSGDPRTMREQDYVAVGRISGSIDQKAEGILKKLSDGNPLDLKTVERVMKALTDLDERGRASRHRQKLSELQALIVDSLKVSSEEGRTSLSRVLDTMRSEDTSFLQISDGDDPEIDIGHEALIRSWKRLSGEKRDFADGWLREERQDGDQWRSYVSRANEGLQITPAEQRSLPKWLRERLIGEIWTGRYGNHWREVAKLRQRSRRATNLRRAVAACGVLVLLLGIGLVAVERLGRLEELARNGRRNALELANQARGKASEGDSRVAALLAIEAQRAADVSGGQDLAEPEQALLDALAGPVETVRLPIGARVSGVSFSPDGRLIAATSTDGKLRVWNMATFEPVPLRAELDKNVFNAAFSPRGDGLMLIASKDAPGLVFRQWNILAGRTIGEPIKDNPCQSVPGFSTDGTQIVASLATDTFQLCRWDAGTGTLLDNPMQTEPGGVSHSANGPDAIRIQSVAWRSPDNSRGVSLSTIAQNSPRLWDSLTGQPIGQLEGHTAPVVGVTFSPDGRRIVTASMDNTARIWDSGTGQMLGLLRGHTGSVNSAAFSPDGLRIVSASNDNTLRLWDANTFQEMGPPIRGHASSVYAVAFSPDGRHVVSGSDDKTIRVWDVGGPTGKYLGAPFQAHTLEVENIAVSPDGKRAVSASNDSTVRIWDVATGRLIGRPLRGHTDVVSIAVFSPDGSQVVSASVDNTLRLWDAKTGLPIGEPLRGHSDMVLGAAFSPDGTRIASASGDKTVRLWDARTGRPIGAPLRGHDSLVISVAFSPDGRQILSSSLDGTIRFWDAETGEAKGAPLRAGAPLMASAFSPDGLRIASACTDGTVRLWDASTGKAIGEPFRGHTAGVNTVAFSPDGREILSASEDRTLRLWNAATGEPIGEPLKGHSGRVSSGVFTPDGNTILSSSEDRSIRVWDVASRDSHAWPADSHTGAVWSVAYSPDGKRIASASDDLTLRVWDAKSGEAIGQPLRGHTDAVESVAFSPDGSKIVSASADTTVRLWDAKTFTAIGQPLRGHTDAVWSVAFSPDGERIVSASADKTLRLWDAVSGKLIGEPMQGHDNKVTSATFSPDGARILSTSADGTLRLWDAASGRPIGQSMQGHGAEVTSAAFSPDGKTFASASADHTLRLWDAVSGKPLRTHRMRHAGPVNSVAFSPNGRFIVSTSNDETVRLWDAKTGLPIGASLSGHTQEVLDAVFSPDGAHIVSASADSTLRVWSLDFPLERSSAQAEAIRLCPLSDEEEVELSLLDPITYGAAPEKTADQKRACGEPETAADR
jgi:WD40 repeat protein